uniref:Bm13640 n=1 Tax=Brugia malayi TaxID=6279 RepID=A0A1I9G3N7_BRUMA|nr:Bm13640 [Brugia malayi]
MATTTGEGIPRTTILTCLLPYFAISFYYNSHFHY